MSKKDNKQFIFKRIDARRKQKPGSDRYSYCPKYFPYSSKPGHAETKKHSSGMRPGGIYHN